MNKGPPLTSPYPVTPDGRYFVVKGRLWRRSNPALTAAIHQALVHELMNARRDVKAALQSGVGLQAARARVGAAKRALGERGPVWWDDGAPDLTGSFVKNTDYRTWYAAASKGGAG